MVQRRSFHICTSAIFTCLSISQNSYYFYRFSHDIYVDKKYGLKFLAKGIMEFFLISLVPNILYLIWSRNMAEFDFVTNIGLLHIMPKSLKAFTSLSTYKLSAIEIVSAVSVGLAIPAVIAIINAKWEEDYPILFWTLSMLLEIIAVAAVIKLKYYFIFITPIVAIWAGKTFGKLCDNNKAIISVFVGLLILALTNYKSCNSFFVEKNSVFKQAEVIQRYTDKDDLIIIGTMEPTLLNQSRRSGWRANIKYYKDIPIGAEKEINYLIEKGAKYFSPFGGYIYGDDGSYSKYLDENFEKLGEGDYFIYKLR